MEHPGGGLIQSFEFMANELPGVRVPDDVLDRMRRANGPAAAAGEGNEVARELVGVLRGLVQGVLVSAPAGRLEPVLEVLEGRG